MLAALLLIPGCMAPSPRFAAAQQPGAAQPRSETVTARANRIVLLLALRSPLNAGDSILIQDETGKLAELLTAKIGREPSLSLAGANSATHRLQLTQNAATLVKLASGQTIWDDPGP
jgi:hypothetical protein